MHGHDGVLIQTIGVVAGLVGGLVAGIARRCHIQHGLAAGLAEFVALHQVLEDEVPGGLAIPEIDLQRAAGIGAEGIGDALA